MGVKESGADGSTVYRVGVLMDIFGLCTVFMMRWLMVRVVFIGVVET